MSGDADDLATKYMHNVMELWGWFLNSADNVFWLFLLIICKDCWLDFLSILILEAWKLKGFVVEGEREREEEFWKLF